jgi:Bifunctional DNA primase/polymerase, N-terminal
MDILQNRIPGRKDAISRNLTNNGVVGKPLPQTWTQSIPGEEATTLEHVYEASKRLVEAGLSVIPIEAYEGSKGPDSLRLPHPRDQVCGIPSPSWSIYKMRRPTLDELRRWREINGPYGLAVLGGAVSGGQYGLGLEIIDIDTATLAEPWIAVVEGKAPGLVKRLIRVHTPRPGLHAYYRCSRFGVSQKLAFADAKDAFGQTALDPQGNPIRKTTIEVKAEAGYCIIPPSPPRTHPTCRLYQYADGTLDLTAVPTITPEERCILLDAARSLNEWHEAKPVPISQSKTKRAANTALPGDDFNARGNWPHILTKHGWTLVGEYGDEARWCRPGKDAGVSGTTNHSGCGLLHVFTSNDNYLAHPTNACLVS